ncbi:MAG TPA: ABC transporter ATP-binding protein [Rhizomicrobium sp.]|jgi:subfamily B ATP-binding cassette protein MsbA|nr:ABC transporter ATP-binding protein [Rhizomicrobium sp.]
MSMNADAGGLPPAPIIAEPAPKPRDNSAIIGRLFRDYVRKQWATLAVAVGCMAVTAGMTAALSWLTDPVIKLLFLDKRADMLLIVPAAIFGVVVVRAVTQYVQQSLMDTVGERAVANTQHDMLASLLRQDLASLNAVHSATFISNFIYDATLMRDAIIRGIAGIGLELLSLIALAGVMIYQDWRLAAIAVVVLPGAAWVTQIIGASLRRAASRGMEETAELSTALSEMLEGRRIIKSYGLEEHIAERTDARLQARLKFLLRVVRRRAAAVPSSDLFGGLVIAATIAYAGYQAAHNEIGINHFASFLTALLLALQPVRNLTQLWATASSGISAADRLFGIIDRKPAIGDAAGAAALPAVPALRGRAITFEDVSFAYHDNASPVLSGVSFAVGAGQKVALVGPSGAGKSTVFNLLLRFYEIDAGRICVDGQDIQRVTLDSLRRNIALVTQEAVLFDESVADNIALGRLGASRTEIETAAKNAAADEFIRQMPQGYDTRVGEGGLKLSGGQRQRIAIARAMLRDAPILLLDEATSALDAESERQVQEALARLMKNRTTVVIAHRLSTVLDADRIYVLDKSRVVESGTHGELIARGGLYARLYQHDFADDAGQG